MFLDYTGNTGFDSHGQGCRLLYSGIVIKSEFLFFKIYKGNDIWLDYSDDSIEGTWLNEEGVQINFTLWNESQPDGSIYENCVILSGESGNWFDVSCYEHHPWICRIHHASDCTPYY